MKYISHLLIIAFLFCNYNLDNKTTPVKEVENNELNKSGYSFEVNVTKINSKYSEIPSAMFRDRLVIVSSKKIGAFGSRVNPITNEPCTDLFYVDIEQNGEFTQPLLFSRILNTKANEGQVTFSLDENTIYYTRSERNTPLNYKLYMAKLSNKRHSSWVDNIELNISSDDYSIENPHVSADGKYLYFSSNMEGGFGGFDLYKAEIYDDGGLGQPENLGGYINSSKDEKYPHTTKDGKELYFSSKGHNSIGGYDIFISNIRKEKYTEPRNLGYEINSKKDEVAFMLIKGNRGVFSSNKDNPTNAFNMYHFESETLFRELQGVVVTSDNKILPNVTVVLLNNEGVEIGRQTTSENASYSFKVKPFENYQLIAVKKGFEETYASNLQPKQDKLQTILRLDPNKL